MEQIVKLLRQFNDWQSFLMLCSQIQLRTSEGYTNLFMADMSYYSHIDDDTLDHAKILLD